MVRVKERERKCLRAVPEGRLWEDKSDTERKRQENAKTEGERRENFFLDRERHTRQEGKEVTAKIEVQGDGEPEGDTMGRRERMRKWGRGQRKRESEK